MSLQLYVSNSLPSLSLHLSQLMILESEDVFQPTVIVTQTEGMNNWLLAEIADHTGIASNIEFKKPGDIVQQVYWLLGGDAGQIIARQSLDWLIYKVLDREEFQRLFRSQAAYYNQDPLTEDIRKMSLAGKLADLFDQYQIYRSHIVRLWNEKNWKEAEPAFQWQAYIWQQLRKEAGKSIPDMTHVSSYILEALRSKEKVQGLVKKMPRIFLFGISIITQYHIGILHELAKHIDLHFYLLNPSPEVYWIEDKSERDMLKLQIKRRNDIVWEAVEGNSLLTNWGKVLQNTFGMLYQTDTFLNQTHEIDTREPARDSLLHKIQNDIFNNRTEGIRFDRGDLYDESLLVTSHFSKSREVEGLYNYLLDIFDRKKIPGLGVRDVLVMVNDMEAYAPFIRAVFKNAPVQFPFHIADESIAQGDNLLSALADLLEISEQDFTSETVLQLLDHQSVRDRFEIHDMDHIRRVVADAGIRFGMENEEPDDSYIVGWVHGLRRIMYGICLTGEVPYKVHGAPLFYCTDHTEGTGQMHQVVRFADFVTRLMNAVKKRKSHRNIGGWVAYINEVMDDFICFDTDENEKELQALQLQLEKYQEVSELVNSDFSFDVFSRHLLDHLAQEQRTRLFYGGGITFCSQIPMRSIPFRVIAMLGLGLNEFPRKEVKIDFNLIQQKRQMGDRNIKDNDKHLFLETILSAREKLYLSFVGRSAKDNADLPPSILVSELLDYVQTGFNAFIKENGGEKFDVREAFLVQHPLHSFSSLYNSGALHFQNYLLKASHQSGLLSKQSIEESVLPQTLSVKDMLLFCDHPIRFYYNRVLNIYYRNEEFLLPETELFSLDTLQDYNLKQRLLQATLTGEDIRISIDAMKHKALLPLKNAAWAAVQSSKEIAVEMAAVIRKEIGNLPESKLYIDLEIAGRNVSGILDGIFGDQLFLVSFSNKNPRRQVMGAYVKYLLAAASGLVSKVWFSTIKDVIHVPVISKASAVGELSFVIEKMQIGWEHPVIFGKDLLLEPRHVQPELGNKNLFERLSQKINSYAHAVTEPYIVDCYQKGMLEKYTNAELYAELFTRIFEAGIRTFKLG